VKPASVSVIFRQVKPVFRANKETSNVIGWRKTLTTSPANHIRVSLARASGKPALRALAIFAVITIWTSFNSFERCGAKERSVTNIFSARFFSSTFVTDLLVHIHQNNCLFSEKKNEEDIQIWSLLLVRIANTPRAFCM
jgi:hypothetical protein